MLYTVLYYTAVILGLFITSLILYTTISHFRCLQQIKFYEKQGVVGIPGYKTFFLGNGLITGQQELSRDQPEPNKNLMPWLCDLLEPETKEYDAAKYPVTLMNLVSNAQLLVADPHLVQQFWTSKNAIYDKTGELQWYF